jgi:hypothetical protein
MSYDDEDGDDADEANVTIVSFGRFRGCGGHRDVSLEIPEARARRINTGGDSFEREKEQAHTRTSRRPVQLFERKP